MVAYKEKLNGKSIGAIGSHEKDKLFFKVKSVLS